MRLEIYEAVGYMHEFGFANHLALIACSYPIRDVVLERKHPNHTLLFWSHVGTYI